MTETWSSQAVRGETMELPIYRPPPRVPGRVFPGEPGWRRLVVRLLMANLVVSAVVLVLLLGLALS